ncbi:MAG: hypothetical protein JXB48_03405 [Candidatus Latescibacteria bacterium]|nr:hypothetical protein [Candidatus Latescibacterota bacterium]
MKRLIFLAVSLSVLLVFKVSLYADTTTEDIKFPQHTFLNESFPKIGYKEPVPKVYQSDQNVDVQVIPAVWPFSSGDSKDKPKSTRKAFFLSMLVPGLGEMYVGSKRGIAFLGIEALAWWMYMTNTNEGNDLEDDFRAFADEHWVYYDDTEGPSYWNWLKAKKYVKDETIGPEDYDKIEEELKKNAEISVHHYTGRKDQQDYEMIGKYPQFVYGWEDIDDVDTDGNPINTGITENDGSINYDLDISTIASPYRSKYEDMRDDSNKKLKAGQRGIHIMIINRVLSAVDAGRLAYNHNKKLESELSSIQIHMVQKHIIDNNVPMITITKKF